ncbi:MAG: hypothetical protein F4Y38_09770 [Gemmatimonadetes bacterium]|nr:hypothetical protein [Gemmatimonadota bacterium]MYG86879.1 hypothetical protein [Gemmatimonadota bacterium]MYJ89362.1 hypothetical protein [Gemmatimonadota bacterium]
MDPLTAQLKNIRARFDAGALTREDIDEAIALVEKAEAKHGPGSGRQGLLYLQAPTTNPHSAVVGISIYEDGTDSDGLDDNGEFRYRTIKEALDDGWRIIKFPEASLAMREQDTYGLGYEFVLERWR